jgi:hypothetical protein
MHWRLLTTNQEMDNGTINIMQYNRHTPFYATVGIITAFYVTCHLNYQNSKSTNFKKALKNFHHLFAGLLTQKSACVRRVPRWPSRHRFLGFSPSSCQCYDGFRDSKFYCSPPDLYSSKLITLALKWASSLFPNYALQHYPKWKFSDPCFKPQLEKF